MASSTIPETQTGILIEKTGGTEVLQYKTDLPVPKPKEGEILVKNEYTGINFIDTYFRTGLYPSPKPEILGREASGTVVDVGPGETYSIKKGDRVVYVGSETYAEYTTAPAVKAYIIPEGIPSHIAAASLLQGLTALTLVREAYPVKAGDWILVHAAAGGTGGWLSQLLRVIGARVIGTASTQAKRDLAKSLGAEFLIDYTTEDLVARVKEITGGQGVAAVFDGVGKSTFDADLELLARKGTLVSFGNASGAVPPVTISRLSAKNVKLLRPTLFGYTATREEFTYYVDELFRFIAEHNLKAGIHEIYPLKDVARAHNDLEGRKTTGKLLLQP